MIKHLIRVTAALLLVAVHLPAAAESATVTRAWQFKPESAQGLQVRNLIGNIRVERGTDPGFHVQVRATIDASSRAEAERLLGLIEYRSADLGAGSRFDVAFLKEHFPKIYWSGGSSDWWSVSYVEHLDQRIRLTSNRGDAPEIRVDLVIRAPAGSTLDVHNLFGESAADGVSHGLAGLFLQIGHDHARAVGRQHARRALTQARRAAGDDEDLACDVHVACPCDLF